ncbi:MAG: hypothetical protein E7258_08170 [Lachnospiraceae bacterium]|nr:hypothetical protein [Lachnospiraceae bacterium]
MSEDMKSSYKRKLYVILAGIIFLLGLSIILEKTDFSYNFVSEKETVTNKLTQTYTYVQEYEEPIQYVYDDTMYKDETVIYQEGEEGSKSVTVMSVYKDGVQTEEKILDTEIIQAAEPEIIYVGTKDRPEYIIPVTNYVISSGFGPRWGTSHNGVDLAVDMGTPVAASKDGIVTQAGWNGGYGISVYVEHENGVVTRYAHLSELNVEVGQQVSQGDIIAYSGNTGRSTGPHLHFEIRIDGQVVNPLDYVED